MFPEFIQMDECLKLLPGRDPLFPGISGFPDGEGDNHLVAAGKQEQLSARLMVDASDNDRAEAQFVNLQAKILHRQAQIEHKPFMKLGPVLPIPAAGNIGLRARYDYDGCGHGALPRRIRLGIGFRNPLDELLLPHHDEFPNLGVRP